MITSTLKFGNHCSVFITDTSTIECGKCEEILSFQKRQICSKDIEVSDESENFQNDCLKIECFVNGTYVWE